MVDFIKQDTTDIKIIVWDRYAPHIKNKDHYQNTYFFSKIDFYEKTNSDLIPQEQYTPITTLLDYILKQRYSHQFSF